MTDINTVSLSGVLTSIIQLARSKGMALARLFINVEGAGDKRAVGNFKIVAFAEQADAVKELAEGDRIALVGALLERKSGETEIRARNIIPLSQRERQDDIDKKDDTDKKRQEETEQQEPESDAQPGQ